MYTLESDNISKGLQVKAKSNGGTSKGSEGVFPTYLISKIDDLSLQKDTANEIAVQTKSGGGISKGSEGVFQTYEISGVDSQTEKSSGTIYYANNNIKKKLSVTIPVSTFIVSWSL